MDYLPHCPENLPDELQNSLKDLALVWAENPIRPKLKKDMAEYWDTLVREWVKHSNLPIYIRKMSEGRGQVIQHHSGRELIPTDNSPAHWSFVMAYLNKKFELKDIKSLIEKDEIPIAMMLKKDERKKARFLCTRNKIGNPNQFGWKVAHKTQIGLNRRGNIQDLPINVLENHFVNFISPSNMFLVPKKWSGLGELPEVTSVMKERL